MTGRAAVFDSIDSLAPASMDLLARQPSPFQDRDWFGIFETQVAPFIGEPRWLQLQDDDLGVMLLPMLARQSGKSKQLTAMSNYYSPYFDLLAHQPKSIANYQEFIRQFQGTLRAYDVVELSPLTTEVSEGFRQAFRQQGWHCHRYPMSVNWRESKIASFAEYWAHRPGQLREAVARRSKKLARQQCRWAINSGRPTEAQLADYHRVYYLSWKPNEPFPVFIDDLVHELGNRGELTLGLLYIDERPVAAQIWIFRGGTGYIYKLAYDPAYSELSPGTLLSAKLFEHAISDRGVDTIDYLTGDDNYKKQWTSEQRPLFGLQIANTRTFRGAAASMRNILSDLRHRRG